MCDLGWISSDLSEQLLTPTQEGKIPFAIHRVVEETQGDGGGATQRNGVCLDSPR